MEKETSYLIVKLLKDVLLISQNIIQWCLAWGMGGNGAKPTDCKLGDAF